MGCNKPHLHVQLEDDVYRAFRRLVKFSPQYCGGRKNKRQVIEYLIKEKAKEFLK